jgi:hypothetical protein
MDDGIQTQLPDRLSGLPPDVLRNIAAALWEDAALVPRLAATCRTIRFWLEEDEQQLWRRLLERRFGPAVLPTPLPEGNAAVVCPAALEGWVFVQGLEPPEREQDVQVTEKHSLALASLAEAAKKAGTAREVSGLKHALMGRTCPGSSSPQQ